MRHVESYNHKSRVGVLVELETDTEATASREEFRQLARDVVLQIAASKPSCIEALLGQPFIKDPDQLVSHRIYVVATTLNAPIRITRFTRYDEEPDA